MPIYKLLSLGFYTHAQRIFWACKLLIERPHIVELLAGRFPEIIVDEAQDTNAWLLILLHLLRDKGAKITLIGDPDQCIFRVQYGGCDIVAQSEDEVVNPREAPESVVSLQQPDCRGRP